MMQSIFHNQEAFRLDYSCIVEVFFYSINLNLQLTLGSIKLVHVKAYEVVFLLLRVLKVGVCIYFK